MARRGGKLNHEALNAQENVFDVPARYATFKAKPPQRFGTREEKREARAKLAEDQVLASHGVLDAFGAPVRDDKGTVLNLPRRLRLFLASLFSKRGAM